ncbi:unnamed protein product [Brugia timori]|uniref:Uncharacterized protein n=1 Tax=Brugia timori TaxID=42155 RepID=A0A3P7T9P9_9BILA|nr:unnamed protein product [Brugia timori]
MHSCLLFTMKAFLNVFNLQVVNIRSEGQTVRRGTAIVSLSSQEALANALKMNSMVNSAFSLETNCSFTFFKKLSSKFYPCLRLQLHEVGLHIISFSLHFFFLIRSLF